MYYELARWLSLIFFLLLLMIYKKPTVPMIGSFTLMAVLWFPRIRGYFATRRQDDEI